MGAPRSAQMPCLVPDIILMFFKDFACEDINSTSSDIAGIMIGGYVKFAIPDFGEAWPTYSPVSRPKHCKGEEFLHATIHCSTMIPSIQEQDGMEPLL